MKKFLAFLSICCPILTFAASSLTFAPPPSDVSVVFLGNLFGVVDGVLNGTGSQIMGSMFAVFNSAVLALGGIIIMYTMIVSTLNTANEGQMMGQKWNSVWVPLRSTIGLGLLVPQASGYCMMQVFIMWIVVQGVGAADKVWDAALDYLNRGGVIVQQQANPGNAFVGSGTEISQGAATILNGQVCMLGLQQILTNQRELYLRSRANSAGPCFGTSNIPGMDTFCNSSVPDFIGTVNAVAVQSDPANKGKKSFAVTMPNFDASSPFAYLNGMCGTLNWNAIQNFNPSEVQGTYQLSNDAISSATIARAAAIQQMYTNLSSVSEVIVNNNPELNPEENNVNTTPFSPIAISQFGIPLTIAGQPCQSTSGQASTNCISWGTDAAANASTGTSTAPLFSGTEFQGAIAAYNGVMLPTLTLMANFVHMADTQKNLAFIQQSKADGWLLAGSYFFQLARLNAYNTNPNLTDSNSGLRDSTFDISQLTSMFGSNNNCVGPYKQLCFWLNKDNTHLNQLNQMFSGVDNKVAPPDFNSLGLGSSVGFSVSQQSNSSVVTGTNNATVFGFLNNSMQVKLPNQPGQNPHAFGMQFNIRWQAGPTALPTIDFPCGEVVFVCLGRIIGELIWNMIIRTLLEFIFSLVTNIVNAVVMAMIYIPLQGIAQVFKQTVLIIQQPSANPVIALANMGATYINFVNELWINLITTSLLSTILGPFGIVIMALIMLVLPILLGWLAVMVSIGIIAAYYVPFLPYMLFTFGSIAWLTSVIEAMVAGPIVALGVTHPEGHDAFGKGEQAIMILMNVFLRPAMMIIGFIAGIAMTFISVWIINAGFSNAMLLLTGDMNAYDQYTGQGGFNFGDPSDATGQRFAAAAANNYNGYSGWASVYAFFFSVLIYTVMYLTVVQKAFTLITYLPDKVLRWIGGQHETLGQEATQWADESKQQVGKGDEASKNSSGQMGSQLTGYFDKGKSKLTSMSQSGGTQSAQDGGKSSAQSPPESTPSPSDE